MSILKKGRRGFTLIELLVVIAIIGILASIVLVSLNSAREGARDTKRVGDIRNAQLALEVYFSQNTGYPPVAAAGVCQDAQILVGAQVTSVFAEFGAGAAKDPVSSQNYIYGADANDADVTAASATDYVIGADLENANNLPSGDIDGTVLGCDCTGDLYCVSP